MDTDITWRQLQEILRVKGSSRQVHNASPELLLLVLERLGVQFVGSEHDPLEITLRGLASFWRDSRLPQVMDPWFKNDWNIFLALEVGYFYPIRRNKPLPGHPGRVGVLLSDRDYLASVIGDGDESLAQKYASKDYERFWHAIVPQGCTFPYSTVRTRIKRALAILAAALNQNQGVATLSAASRKEARVIPIEVPARTEERLEENPRHNSRNVQFIHVPLEIPDDWKVLVNQVVENRRILLRGASRLHGTQLLSFLSIELRASKMEPVFIDLRAYAPCAAGEDPFHWFHELVVPPTDPMDLLVDHDLVRKWVEANAYGWLVMFGDGIDDVPENALQSVMWRLGEVRRIILPSRRARLFFTDMVSILMPAI